MSGEQNSLKETTSRPVFRVLNKLSILCHSLARFSLIAISDAELYVKSDQKDLARDWFRFLSNAQIPEILSLFPEHQKTAEMISASLVRLGTNCHPLDVPDFQPDFVQINQRLKEIHNILAGLSVASKFPLATTATPGRHTLPETPTESPGGHFQRFKAETVDFNQ